MDWHGARWNVRHDLFPSMFTENQNRPQDIVIFKVPSVPGCTTFHFYSMQTNYAYTWIIIIIYVTLSWVSVWNPLKCLVIPRILILNTISYDIYNQVTGIWTCGGPIPKMTNKDVHSSKKLKDQLNILIIYIWCFFYIGWPVATFILT